MPKLTQEQLQAAIRLAKSGSLTDEEKTKIKALIAEDEKEDRPSSALDTAADLATGITTEVESLGRGIQQIYARVTGNQELEADIQRREAQARAELEAAKQRSPIASTIGQGIGVIGPALTTAPIGGAGSLARAVASSGAIGAGFGATRVAGTDESKLAQTALGGATGAIAAGVLGGVGKGIKSLTASGGRQAALAGTSDDAIKAALEAKKSGVNLTPGEASGLRSVALKETRRALEARAPKQAELNILNRNEEIRKSFDRLVSKITPEGTEATKQTVDDIFSRIGPTKVPSTAIDKFKDNAIIRKGLKIASSSPEFADDFSKLPENSLGRYQLVKEAIQDLRSKAVAKGAKATRAYDKSVELIKQELVKASPEYSIALEKSQQLIIQREVVSRLANIAGKETTGKVLPSQIYNEFFGSSTKTADLLKTLSNNPELATQAESFRKGLIKVGIGKLDRLVTAQDAPRSLTGFQALRGMSIDAIRKRYNDAFLEAITNPKWANEIESMRKASSRTKASEIFARILTNIDKENEDK